MVVLTRSSSLPHTLIGLCSADDDDDDDHDNHDSAADDNEDSAL